MSCKSALLGLIQSRRVIGLLICKTSWGILKRTGVSRLKGIKAGYLGSCVYIDVVIEVPSDLNIKESHDIANEVERRMKEEHAIDHSHVHMEPLQLK